MNIIIYLIKDILDHLSVLKAVDGSGFVSNTKRSNIFILLSFS